MWAGRDDCPRTLEGAGDTRRWRSAAKAWNAEHNCRCESKSSSVGEKQEHERLRDAQYGTRQTETNSASQHGRGYHEGIRLSNLASGHKARNCSLTSWLNHSVDGRQYEHHWDDDPPTCSYRTDRLVDLCQRWSSYEDRRTQQIKRNDERLARQLVCHPAEDAAHQDRGQCLRDKPESHEPCIVIRGGINQD